MMEVSLFRSRENEGEIKMIGGDKIMIGVCDLVKCYITWNNYSKGFFLIKLLRIVYRNNF